MIDLLCPKCAHPLAIPDEYRGKTGRCSRCQSPVEVPVNALTREQQRYLDSIKEDDQAEIGTGPGASAGPTPSSWFGRPLTHEEKMLREAKRQTNLARRNLSQQSCGILGCLILILVIFFPGVLVAGLALLGLGAAATLAPSESWRGAPPVAEAPALVEQFPSVNPTPAQPVTSYLDQSYEALKAEVAASTSAQRDNIKEAVIGKRVAWMGEVMEVKANPQGGFLIQIEMDTGATGWVESDVNLWVYDSHAESLATHGVLYFRGTIEGIREEDNEFAFDLESVRYSEEGPFEESSLDQSTSQAPQASVMVYAPHGSSVYHRQTCSRLNPGAESMTRATAEATGLAPCGLCQPEF